MATKKSSKKPTGKPVDLRKALKEAAHAVHANVWKLSGLMYRVEIERVQDASGNLVPWYQLWGYANMSDYVVQELGLEPGDPVDYFHVRDVLSRTLNWKESDLVGLSIVRLSAIVDVITDDNIQDWLSRARTKDAEALKKDVEVMFPRGKQLTSSYTVTGEPGSIKRLSGLVHRLSIRAGTKNRLAVLLWALEYTLKNYNPNPHRS